jgi:hypothetical protein
LLGAFNAHLHGLHTRDLAKATLAIQVQQRACVDEHFHTRVGLKATFKDGIDIARHHAHTMRVVTTQIGHDQIGSHLRRFRSLAACFLKNVGNTLSQLLGWNTLAHEKTFLIIL